MLLTQEKITFFQERLLDWFRTHDRPLPWKEEKDPYLIWLSEIILQQTRVAQGLPYFERFRDAFPTVHHLAQASQDEVMKLWEGLGYYSRARNLHATAQYISTELEGLFPNTYQDVLALKGVGPYTAAAIVSFAYGLPHAVVDGNVYRVLARYAGVATPIDTTAGKKSFQALADALLVPDRAGDYNQAIMDFGATVCVPRSPACGRCPLREECTALRTDRVDQLPVKAKKLKRRTRYFHYFLLNQPAGLWVRKRQAKDIWQYLYEFPLLETDTAELSEAALSQLPQWQTWVGDSAYTITAVSPPQKQELSHQRIVARFWEVDFPNTLSLPPDMIYMARKKTAELAFPRIIDWYLRNNSLFLKLL